MTATFINIVPDTTGQVGVNPRRVKIITDGSLNDITTAGFLDQSNQNGFPLLPTDIFDIIYSFSATTNSGTYGEFLPTFTSGSITLNQNVNEGNVILPVTAGYIATFANSSGVIAEGSGLSPAINPGNIQAGLSGTAGALISYPSTASTGSFEIVAVANTGNTNTVLSNVAMAQASTVSISDPGASTAYLNCSAVNASKTPVGAFITKDVNLDHAALATSGHVTIQASSGSMQFKVRNIFVQYSASGLSGGGGDRLIRITDGTTIYNNAGITAAVLGTPVNTVWGGTGNPLAGTVAANTSTAAGATLYAVYAGGTTDYTAGSVNITVSLERVA